jgi:N-acetylglucosamine malate deacetylase 1
VHILPSKLGNKRLNCIKLFLKRMKLDVLAFGAHPDDVELSCSGVLLVEKACGKKTGIVDLTQGELGTRGSAAIRKEEANAAAAILKVDVRINLEMADGFFVNDKAHQIKIIEVIRRYCPEVILANAPEDRHPDHGKGGALLYDAAFLSGLSKIITSDNGVEQKPWRPKYVFHYIQDRFLEPDVVIDISDVMETKIESIKAYGTQFFNPTAKDEAQTYISTPEFLDSIIARSAMFGKMIGVKYAEGFVTKKKIGIKNIDALVLQNT